MGFSVVAGLATWLFFNALHAGTSWDQFFNLLKNDHEVRTASYYVIGWFFFMAFSNSGGTRQHYNPVTGLPMVQGSNIDIKGNVYGTNHR